MANTRYSTKLSPLLKNKSINTYSPTVFSLITVIIFAVFAIRPTVKTILSLQQTINEQNKTLTTLKTKSENLATAINNYNTIPDTTKIKLFTLLPNSTNVTCLVSDLSNMSTGNQTTISGLQIQSTDLNKPAKCLIDNTDLASYRQNVPTSLTLQELGFNLNNQANFGQLSSFLSQFNNSTRLISVESITFSRPSGAEVGLVVDGKAYFFK
jgi:hypothetical protein